MHKIAGTKTGGEQGSREPPIVRPAGFHDEARSRLGTRSRRPGPLRRATDDRDGEAHHGDDSSKAETDDDHEWLPNPKQKGALGLPVRDEMIDAWLAMMAELEVLLNGTGYNFYDSRERGRSDDLLVRQRASGALADADAFVTYNCTTSSPSSEPTLRTSAETCTDSPAFTLFFTFKSLYSKRV